jgi:hypothetical protein
MKAILENQLSWDYTSIGCGSSPGFGTGSVSRWGLSI